MLEPSLEPVAARARIESVDARADLAERQDAEEEPILVRLVKPLDEPGVGSRLCPLGDRIGVEEEAQSSTLRGPASRRSRSIPELRRGERAKNSARLPVR